MPFSLFLVRIDFIKRGQLYITIFQIIKFLIGGSPGVLVYYGLYYSLTEIFNIYFIFSSILGAIPSIMISFIIKKYWVFKNKNNDFIRKQLRQYLLLAIPSFFGNLGLLWFLVIWLEYHFFLSQIVLTGFLPFLVLL